MSYTSGRAQTEDGEHNYYISVELGRTIKYNYVLKQNRQPALLCFPM